MALIGFAFLAAIALAAYGFALAMTKVFAGPASSPKVVNPNANEPDVFASPDADLDPESDTGEPDGWN
jgi:hypothetical protein